MKILGVVLLLLGVFFALFPHSVHESLFGPAVAHVYHVSFGIVLLAAGAFVGWKSMKKKTPSA